MNFHEDFVIKSSPTGSNYICNPPVTTTDIDTVFLCRDMLSENLQPVHYSEALMQAGWEPCVGEGYEILGGDFAAFRKGNKNYICTTDPAYYNKYVKATKICKLMNLLDKRDRIFMFKVVMEGYGLPSHGYEVNTPLDSLLNSWTATPTVGTGLVEHLQNQTVAVHNELLSDLQWMETGVVVPPQPDDSGEAMAAYNAADVALTQALNETFAAMPDEEEDPV